MLLKRVAMLNSFVSILILFPFVRCIHASECNKTGSQLICTNLNLRGQNSFPANNVQNILEIECKDCTIPLISSGMFRNFADAKKLTLLTNQIHTIESGAFSGMNHLEILHLRGNGISKIQSGTINSLNSLQTLGLWSNKLTKIDKNYFANLTHLTHLDLDSNLLEIITEDAFEGLISLRNLDLRRNRLMYLPAGCFKDLGKLDTLCLQSNLFSNFEYGLFDLNNKLSFINECSFLSLRKLQTLDMENNKLTHLNPNTLTFALPNLNNIYLSGNEWYCNVLSDMLPNFMKRGIALKNNETTTTPNVFGISCVNKTVPDSIRNDNELTIEECVIVNNVRNNNLNNTFISSTTISNNSLVISNSTELTPNCTLNETGPENGVMLNNKTDSKEDNDFIEIIYNTMLRIRTNKGNRGMQRLV